VFGADGRLLSQAVHSEVLVPLHCCVLSSAIVLFYRADECKRFEANKACTRVDMQTIRRSCTSLCIYIAVYSSSA
jgi:hypothetical protein